MGRELQKKKNRSSISKVRQKPKSKKRTLAKNNPIIAQNWDKNQTLSQNYKRLGLTTKLNKNTGGVEKTPADIAREREQGQNGVNDPLSIAHSKLPQQISLEEAKIIRDPETGDIIQIIQPEGKERPNPLNDPLNELESDSESEDDFNQHWDTKPVNKANEAPAKTKVVQELEDQASRPAPKYKRKQPEGEREFVKELVQKYGEDYGKMARDMKINYMQRSEGDLKRRVKKWKESGGTID